MYGPGQDDAIMSSDVLSWLLFMSALLFCFVRADAKRGDWSQVP